LYVHGEHADGGMTATLSIDERARGERTLKLAGRLDATSVAAIWDQAHAAVRDATRVVIEAQDVDYCDGAGLALLFDLRRARPDTVTVSGLRPEFGGLLKQFDAQTFPAPPAKRPRPPLPLIAAIGRGVLRELENARLQIAFLGESVLALAAAIRHPRAVRWKDALLIAERAGVDALPIVALISFLMGLIISFQSAIPLRQYGGEIYVGDLVGLSVLRELGPLMTAILLAGRSGAAFAAELGTMKVNEEINALTTMGLDPVRFLVVTRLLAGIIVTPLLTIFADMIGLLGGALTMLTFSIPTRTYFAHVGGFADTLDFAGGLAKSVVFGVMIAGIGCLKGLQTKTGAAAVGDSTTRAVVSSIIMIVVVDGLFALVYYVLGV
jgi:phospholipid/cholesterol/gamma-HCH transport system permease protein